MKAYKVVHKVDNYIKLLTWLGISKQLADPRDITAFVFRHDEVLRHD